VSQLDVLWGSTLRNIRLDLVRLEVELTIDVPHEGSAADRHMLTVAGLGSLAFENSIPDPWTYAEVTEARAVRNGELIALELILWSEEAQLRVSGRRAWLDGVEIAGE